MPTRVKQTTPAGFSPFQNEKLEYYYRFIVGSADGVLNKESLLNFYKRILAFTGWSENHVQAKSCKEVHDTFFEISLEKCREKSGYTDHVELDAWLSMWATMLHGVMGVQMLPIYIRVLPRVLFQIIDRRGERRLNSNDLAIFYRDMVGLNPTQSQETADRAFEQMTDGGRYPLNEEGYEQLFANFLIGRTPHGPGRYIFGCFEHKVVPFQLIQPVSDNLSEEDVAFTPPRFPVMRRPSKNFVQFPPFPQN